MSFMRGGTPPASLMPVLLLSSTARFALQGMTDMNHASNQTFWCPLYTSVSGQRLLTCCSSGPKGHWQPHWEHKFCKQIQPGLRHSLQSAGSLEPSLQLSVIIVPLHPGARFTAAQ